MWQRVALTLKRKGKAEMMIDEVYDGAKPNGSEKQSWRKIPLNEIVMAIESASDEYSQCYDFRTNQTLFAGGDFDSFKMGFFSELASDDPETVKKFLTYAASLEELSIDELIGEDADLETDDLEQILDDLEDDVMELLEEIYLEDCVAFPDKFDINDYRIMERFIVSETEGEICERLYSAIQGRGAFRCFRNELARAGLEDQWYDYRNKQYIQIARGWAVSNKVIVIE